jgi:hypothetical protein
MRCRRAVIGRIHHCGERHIRVLRIARGFS